MYFAPEMVLKGQHSREIDLWSLGVMAYELSNFFLPFDQDDMKENNYTRVVNQGQKHRKWLNSSTSPELKDIINGLLVLEPRNRLGAVNWSQLKEHPFFRSASFDWEALKRKKMVSPLLPVLKVALEYEKVSKQKNFPKKAQLEPERKRDTIDCWTENNSMLVKR
jgi:serine/threonine protein kinase